MRRILVTIMCFIFLCGFYGCGDTKYINGKKYGTYGLINKSEMKNEDIEYRLVIGNIVWSCILVETIIAPIYFLGFSVYEPVGPKTTIEKGIVY